MSVVLCVLLGTRLSPIPFAPVAGLVGIALLPVLLPSVRRFRTALPLISLLGVAVITGVALTALQDATHATSLSLLFSRSAMVIALIGGVAIVLFAREHIGSAGAATAYGVGMLASVLLEPISSVNPWRFTFSIPIAILLLAVLSVRQHLMPQLLGLVGLGVLGLLNESRANSAILFLAAVVLIWQRLAQAVSRGRRRAGHLIGLVLFAAGFVQLMQFSLLEGYFGEATQVKSETQVATSGNLLLGGRPEAAASFAIIRLHPFGLGSGTLPTGSDIYAAKSGMSSIGYDPDNGYVERFMFGNGIEVHSMLGDFWIWFGLAGVAACVAMCVTIFWGLEHRLRNATVSGLLAYLSLRFVWDLLFSPAASSMKLLTLALPLAAIAVAAASTKATTPIRRRADVLGPALNRARQP